jgi:photosystem II stability/assembly factor-like uncharacterized protein
MTFTRAAVATFAVASLAATIALPTAAASPQPSGRLAAGSQADAVATSATCHRKASPATYVAPHALDAVQFVSGTTGWVAGADRVLATTDGGAHWSMQRSAPRADYSEVDAIDGDHAWIVGRRQLIATTNGGATWKTLPEPCPAISSVHFYSASDGVAVDGGKLLKTSDGGARWRHAKAPAAVQSVCFTNPRSGWLGAHGQIYRTVDGARWARAVSAGPVSKHPADQSDAIVQCSGSDAGWAEIVGPGGASNQEPHIGYHLSDTGSRPIFAEQYFPHKGVKVRRESPGAYYAAFSAVDPSDAAFVDTCSPCGRGTSPVGIAEDAGRTFIRPGNVGRLTFSPGAAFVSTADGWVVGEVIHYGKDGSATWKIVHTSDAGKKWTTQYSR